MVSIDSVLQANEAMMRGEKNRACMNEEEARAYMAEEAAKYRPNMAHRINAWIEGHNLLCLLAFAAVLLFSWWWKESLYDAFAVTLVIAMLLTFPPMKFAVPPAEWVEGKTQVAHIGAKPFDPATESTAMLVFRVDRLRQGRRSRDALMWTKRTGSSWCINRIDTST